MDAETFPALLADQLRASGSRPLVTFYDDRTGERVELSVVTYANWVAKTANLLQDELGLERGDLVLVDLPPHWLGPVWLGAAWSLGVAVTDAGGSAGRAPDAVVCGPATLEAYAAAGRPVVALSLLPMAARFRTGLPPGVLDFGAVVWGQPDGFLPYDPPAGGDAAWLDAEGAVSQAALLEAAGRSDLSGLGTRLLTDLNPSSRAGVEAFVAPLLGGGGTVWVAEADPDGWERRAEAEHVTRSVRGSDAR